MARPVRMDFPNTFYHILSRGNERRDIFREPRDYEKFTETIGRMVERFSLEVHAYVLMANHYHLLIRTRDANMSRAIQWLGLTYSVWFNRCHARSGHLFQGRFKSFLVENDKYFSAMCLYVHANPLRAGVVEGLSDYPWSSFPAYARARAKKPWLTTELVLGRYGGSRQKFVNAQSAYVGKKRTVLDELKYGLFLGSKRFVEKWKLKLETERDREKPQVRKALKGQGISVALGHVFALLGIEDPSSLLKPLRGETRPDRDLAIYCLSHLGLFTNQEIGRQFGVGYTSISGALRRAEDYIGSNPKARSLLQNVLFCPTR